MPLRAKVDFALPHRPLVFCWFFLQQSREEQEGFCDVDICPLDAALSPPTYFRLPPCFRQWPGLFGVIPSGTQATLARRGVQELMGTRCLRSVSQLGFLFGLGLGDGEKPLLW